MIPNKNYRVHSADTGKELIHGSGFKKRSNLFLQVLGAKRTLALTRQSQTMLCRQAVYCKQNIVVSAVTV